MTGIGAGVSLSEFKETMRALLTTGTRQSTPHVMLRKVSSKGSFGPSNVS